MNTAEFKKEVREIARYNEFNLSNEEAITAITQAAEALATHRAVELAEKVIGSDDDVLNVWVPSGWSVGDRPKAEAMVAQVRNELRAEQRAALAQLKGLEGK